VAKLPTSKRVDWARHAASIEPFRTVAHFSAWLQTQTSCVRFWTSRERSRDVEFCMRASTRTDAINRMIGMEVVQFVEGNMLRRAAVSSLELRHRVGGAW